MKKTILITGASHGIGAATAHAFAKAGYDVAINYRRNRKDAETTAARCVALGAEVLLVQADMSVEAEIAMAREKISQTFGALDVLVNNAAFTEEPDFSEATSESILHALSHNFLTAALTTRAFVPSHMNDGGSVLNVASVYGLRGGGSADLPIYSASKAALINLTETLALKYAPRIRFNAVAPGYTKTPAWGGTPEDRVEACLDATLLKEWVSPEEIAATLLFLAETPHINAETIVVDGGFMKKQNS